MSKGKLWFKNVNEVAGPLVVVEGVGDVGYQEIAEIKFPDGQIKKGQVLMAEKDKAVVQIFGSNIGLSTQNTEVSFTGYPAKMPVSEKMLGRVFNGLGEIIDGGPNYIPEKQLDINGEPINPYAREMPNAFLQTGISAIDLLSTLVRGQKLPIFSGSGLPHSTIATQIARQATVYENGSESKDFVIIFGAMGITSDESQDFLSDFEKTGVLANTVLFMNLANDPVVERITLPRVALTTAEYFAYEKDKHVLVLLTDITNYANALREVSSARKEIPGRRGYPGYLYTDLAMMYERAGVVKKGKGSVTMLPILSMPDDDKTHPIPDLTGYITEGQVALSRRLHRAGVYPPIDVLSSLSRLKDKGTGEGKTREDHPDMANQVFASYAKGLELRDLAQILGESSLSDTDRAYIKFAQQVEDKLIRQGRDENRTIQQTLEISWELMKILPRKQLKRLKDNMVEKYLDKK